MFGPKVKLPEKHNRFASCDAAIRRRANSIHKHSRQPNPPDLKEAQRLLENHMKVCEENAMLHEYFDVFEKRYVENRRRMELLQH